MRFILLTLMFFTGCSSTTVMQERVEKMRIGVPALFSVEIDYYKDSENEVKNKIPKPTSVEKHNTYLGVGNPYPKLMPMNRK